MWIVHGIMDAREASGKGYASWTRVGHVRAKLNSEHTILAFVCIAFAAL